MWQAFITSFTSIYRCLLEEMVSIMETLQEYVPYFLRATQVHSYFVQVIWKHLLCEASSRDGYFGSVTNRKNVPEKC